MENIYNNTPESYFKKPLFKNLYFTIIGILIFITYLLTKNRIIGLIALNLNIAILLSTEFVRWWKSDVYHCFKNYIKNSINVNYSADFISKVFISSHYIPPLILLFNINKFLKIPLSLQLYYSLLSFLVFLSWTCITNDCVSMENIYLSYDDSSCKYKIKKTVSIKILIIMLFGNFLVPFITILKRLKNLF